MVVAHSGGASHLLWEYIVQKRDTRDGRLSYWSNDRSIDYFQEIKNFNDQHKVAARRVKPSVQPFERKRGCFVVGQGRLISFFDLEKSEDLCLHLLQAVVNQHLPDPTTSNNRDWQTELEMGQMVPLRKAVGTDPAGTTAARRQCLGQVRRCHHLPTVDASLAIAYTLSIASKALMLAVRWNRPRVATEILDALSGLRKAYPRGAGSTPAFKAALQLAVELARTDFVAEMLRQPGAFVQLSQFDGTKAPTALLRCDRSRLGGIQDDQIVQPAWPFLLPESEYRSQGGL